MRKNDNTQAENETHIHLRTRAYETRHQHTQAHEARKRDTLTRSCIHKRLNETHTTAFSSSRPFPILSYNVRFFSSNHASITRSSLPLLFLKTYVPFFSQPLTVRMRATIIFIDS